MENIMFKQKSFSMPQLGRCDLFSSIFLVPRYAELSMRWAYCPFTVNYYYITFITL